MSVKSNSIKKKALEFARKRDWKNAIKEYNRLAELEQTNPNIFNELGDLHLKAEEKSEAFKSYEKAIAAYKHVGLFNNAIAVCKKIIALGPVNEWGEGSYLEPDMKYKMAFLEAIKNAIERKRE